MDGKCRTPARTITHEQSDLCQEDDFLGIHEKAITYHHHLQPDQMGKNSLRILTCPSPFSFSATAFSLLCSVFFRNKVRNVVAQIVWSARIPLDNSWGKSAPSKKQTKPIIVSRLQYIATETVKCLLDDQSEMSTTVMYGAPPAMLWGVIEINNKNEQGNKSAENQINIIGRSLYIITRCLSVFFTA